MRTRLIPRADAALALVVALSAGQAGPTGAGFTEDPLKGFSARALGPYRAGSWVTSLAVPDMPARDHLYTLYVGTRNGGVWKTVNNGTTFEPVFDGQPKLSIGDVAVAPSNANVVWVGTGEAYCARSSNSGDGVWKSVDAGKTWTNMGREFTIASGVFPNQPRLYLFPVFFTTFTDGTWLVSTAGPANSAGSSSSRGIGPRRGSPRPPPGSAPPRRRSRRGGSTSRGCAPSSRADAPSSCGFSRIPRSPSTSSFTDLLLAVFHLAEELHHRRDLAALPETDLAHLEGDLRRTYGLLVHQWLDYLRYLQGSYPYLFSLAVRTNPFDEHASPVVTR